MYTTGRDLECMMHRTWSYDAADRPVLCNLTCVVGRDNSQLPTKSHMRLGVY